MVGLDNREFFMSQHDAEIDFATLDQSLGEAGALMGAAEAHGLLCGLLCAAGEMRREDWKGQVLEDSGTFDAALEAALDALYVQTLRQLNDSNLGFEPLLSDDRSPLAERALNLRRWSQGFLSGIGLGGIREGAKLPEEVYGFLRDMLEVAKVDFALDEVTEEDEAAYAEVLEFVRMGVLLVNEELQPVKKPPQVH